MSTCTECGHPHGIGRFCTNCGHPVAADAGGSADWRSDTVERPRVAEPAPVPVMPEPVRFPLFADEPAPAADPTPTAPTATPPAPGPGARRHRGGHRGAWLGWLAGFVALAAVAGLGAWLLFTDPDAPRAAGSAAEATAGADDPEPSEPAEPTDPTGPTSEPPTTEPAEPGDLAPFAEVSAPAPAPASQDTSGDVVQYVATNLVDATPETCWRMPGDGTGESITFRFEGPVRLTEVGLVNGYAKRTSDSRGVLDWYAGNRRVRAVEWTFEDGTVVTQRLADTTEMQTVELDDVETESVTLRLLEVTPPGPGRASRDYTPISDVRLVGATLT